MKQAKASERDIQAVIDFFNVIEEAVEQGVVEISGKEVRVTDDVLSRLVHCMWGQTSSAWRRVVFGYKVLVDNACDPDANTLEWRPDIAALIHQAEINRSIVAAVRTAKAAETPSPAGPTT